MDDSTLRLWIKAKLDGGLLPKEGLLKMWGGGGSGRPCEGCDKIIPEDDLEIEGLSAKRSIVRFHVKCFNLWAAERGEAGHQSSCPA